jgi:hypothetical protein
MNSSHRCKVLTPSVFPLHPICGIMAIRGGGACAKADSRLASVSSTTRILPDKNFAFGLEAIG